MWLWTFAFIILGVSFVPSHLEISHDDDSSQWVKEEEDDPTVVVADCANGTLYNVDVDFTSTIVENGKYDIFYIMSMSISHFELLNLL